jgi:bacteriocin-like protein
MLGLIGDSCSLCNSVLCGHGLSSSWFNEEDSAMSDKIVRELTDDELAHVSGGAAPTSPVDLMQMLSQILSSMQAVTNETIRNLR